MKTLLYLFSMLLVFSCTNDTNSNLISEIENEGYNYIGECAPPYGIIDTLILGYTKRTNGVFHTKELRPKNLKIKGHEFEKVSTEKWKSKLFIYEFEFGTKEEIEQFEEFQDFLLNYQHHYKNKVEFFQQDATWFLRFEPMP